MFKNPWVPCFWIFSLQCDPNQLQRHIQFRPPPDKTFILRSRQDHPSIFLISNLHHTNWSLTSRDGQLERDGSTYWFRVTAHPLASPDGAHR